jgi:hypothetical protein
MNYEQAYQWLHGDRTEYSGCRAAAEAVEGEVKELRRLLRQLLNTKEGRDRLGYLKRGIGTATPDVVWLDAAKHLGDA